MRLWIKLSLALVVVAVVPLAVTTVNIVGHDVDALERGAQAYHVATAELALELARSRVSRAVAEARAIGAALAQPHADLDDRIRAARAQLLGAEAVDAVAFYGPDGAQLDVMRAPRDDGRDVPFDPPPRLAEDVRKIAEAERSLTRAVRFPPGGGPPVVPLVVPIHRGDAHELFAFVWIAVDLSPLNAEVADLSARRFAGETDQIELLDELTRVVASADPARLGQTLAGREALAGVEVEGRPFSRDLAHTIEYDNRHGEPVIGAVVPMPELDWAVVVEESRDFAYAAAERAFSAAQLIGVIAAALAILVGILLARRLAAPVVAVADAAGKVAGGDFETRVEVRSRDEVGDLAQAFNEMAGDLADYRDALVDETRVRADLSRFLSAEVVEQVVNGPEELRLGGERRRITVLFADVVAFTRLADEYEPEFVVGILNELFTIMTDIVFKHGGIIDKFIGDCAMAVWGAPTEREDDAVSAVRAAADMLRWLDVGNARWRKQIGRDLELAIGINSGEAVVGNVGSERRMEYTAIGDVVNVAARLERLAHPGQILITREVMEQVGDEFELESVGVHHLVGRSRPSELFVMGR